MLLARLGSRQFASRFLSRGLASSLLSRQKDINESWTLNQLREEAKLRGLSSSGGKAAVLARLEAHDIARAGSRVSLSTSAVNAARGKSTTSTGLDTTAPSAPVASTVAPVDTPKLNNGAPPTGPSDTPIVSHASATPSDPVINKTDENGKVAPRQPFQAKRVLYNPPADSFPGLSASENSNRFQPKRSAPLDITMPEYSEPEEEPTAVPTVPHYDTSETNLPSNPLTSSPAPPPKVVTVSHIDTHLAAPSHPSNDVFVNPPVEVTEYPIPGRPDLKNGSSSSGNGDDYSSSEDLTDEERRGLIVLGGIFVGGWLLGGFGKSSKSTEPVHEKNTGHSHS